MAGTALYALCVLCLLGLYLVLRPGGRLLKTVGVLIGLAALALLFVEITRSATGGGENEQGAFFYIFSSIAVMAAVRMITHTRPVYSALYFVFVVLSSAGLFLLLEAEFIAFALIIIYAGAILITYLFVIMLAQQSPDPHNPSAQPEYDVIPREPAAAVVVGFIMLALFSHMIVETFSNAPQSPSVQMAQNLAWRDLEQMPTQLEDLVRESETETFRLGWDEQDDWLEIAGETASVRYTLNESGQQKLLELPADAQPDNIQRVGLSLILQYREGQLELAGVILLLAMFGAVVLARKHIELNEDEKRQAAGMRRLGYEDEPESGKLTSGGEPS